jgi:hypothetical protein
LPSFVERALDGVEAGRAARVGQPVDLRHMQFETARQPGFAHPLPDHFVGE